MIKNILKRIIGIKNNLFKHVFPYFFYKSGFLSQIYYLLFDGSFRREMRTVLNGKVKHLNDSRVLKSNYYLLVRNIHRLEKGLSMKPRKAIFGNSFISETVDSFEGVWETESSNPQLKWFYDVLHQYFSVVGEDPTIDSCRERFYKKVDLVKSPKASAGDQSASVPYIRALSEYSTITYDEFYKLTKQRRSVRWFSPKPVDRDLIDKAMEAANLSPSACNRQPFEFRIFDDPALVSELVDIPMGTKGYGHTIPVFIVLIGNLDAYFDERDRHVIYVDASLAAMSFMLALETLGLSSCAINWPDIEKKEQFMEKRLGLKPYQRPVMCMGLGYADPDGLVAYSEKRPLDMTRNYNKINDDY